MGNVSWRVSPERRLFLSRRQSATHATSQYCTTSAPCLCSPSCCPHKEYKAAKPGNSSGDRIPTGTRFSVPVQAGPGAHLASCTMDTGSFPGVKSGRAVTLTPHSQCRGHRKFRAVPLLPLWAVRPVQGCTFPYPRNSEKTKLLQKKGGGGIGQESHLAFTLIQICR